MKIILKHIIKNIIENKFLSILIIFSLAISTMVLYLNMTIKDDVLMQYKSILQGTYQNYNYYIYKSNVSSEKSKYFDAKQLNLSDFKIDSSFGLTRTSGVYKYKNNLLKVNIYGIDANFLIEKKLLVLDQVSDDFYTKSENGIIISSRVAEKYGIRLNDELLVSTSFGTKNMLVCGIAKAKGLYLKESTKIMFIASPKYVGHLNRMDKKVCGVYIEKSGDDKQNKFLEQFKSKNKGFSCQKLSDDDSLNAEVQEVNQLLLIVMAAVIIMVFYLNASNTKIIMAKRMPVIGTFRSIGATRLSMNLILISENIVYGAVSGVIGVLLGIFSKNPLMNILGVSSSSDLNLDIQYEFNVSYIVLSIVLTVVFQVLISLFGILTSNRKSIKDAIFNKYDTKVDMSIKKIICGVCMLVSAVILYFSNTDYNLLISGIEFIFLLIGTVCLIPLLILGMSKAFRFINGKVFGAAAELGSKNLANNKTVQSSIVLVTVTLSVMLTIYMAILSVNNVFKHVGETFKGDIQISGITEQAREYNKLYNVKGVKTMQFVYYGFENYIVNNVNINLGIFGIDEEMLGIKDIDNKIGKLCRGEALIDRYYGVRNKIKIGDKLKIKRKKEELLTVKIVGYIDAGDFTSQRNVVVISESEYRNKVSNVPICIEIDTFGDIEKVKESLIKTLSGTNVSVQTIEEFLANNKNSVDSLLLMISIFLGLSILIALFGVISNQLIGFIQRKKEYAVLYSVAMSKLQINIMILTETAGTFIIGCLFASILGICLSKSLEQILFSIGEYVSVSVDILSILGLLLVMFILLMLTTVLPMRKMLKLNVIQEIKYE